MGIFAEVLTSFTRLIYGEDEAKLSTLYAYLFLTATGDAAVGNTQIDMVETHLLIDLTINTTMQTSVNIFNRLSQLIH